MKELLIYLRFLVRNIFAAILIILCDWLENAGVISHGVSINIMITCAVLFVISMIIFGVEDHLNSIEENKNNEEKNQ